MIRALLLLSLALGMATPAWAGLAPELEIQSLDAVTDALDAPLDPFEEGKDGALLLGRDAIGGEAARRAETCRQINQAREEGFEQVLENDTAFYANWLVVKCEVLGLLEGATALEHAKFPADFPFSAPAIFSSRTDCIGSWAALAATLRGKSWSEFEQDWRTAFGAEEGGAVSFVLVSTEAALNGLSGAIGVWIEDDHHLSFRDGALSGRIELLASADLDNDGLAEWIVLHRIADQMGAIDEWRVHTFTASGAGLVLSDPAREIEDILTACPDRLGAVLGDPCGALSDVSNEALQ